MKVLVISHTHHLLPFAWRLKGEGCDVEVIIDRDRYESAWQGRFSLLWANSKGGNGAKRSRTHKAKLRSRVEGEDRVVLTDSYKWLEVFSGYPHLFGMIERPEGAVALPPYLIGAWFDGEEMSGRHFLVEDQGLWPAGLGPAVLGGATLVSPQGGWPDAFEVALSGVKDELKAHSYRGLVKVGIQLDPEEPGEPILVGYQAGWNFLQAHALLAEAGDAGTPSFSDILAGAEPQFAHRYTVALPMTIPPYPNRSAANKHADTLEIPAVAWKSGKFYWHDMAVVDGMVRTAGLDGLVAVVKASANSFRLTSNRLLSYGKLLDLPELQARLDVGSQVEFMLAMLEERGLEV
jgi:hypothetical protein